MGKPQPPEAKKDAIDQAIEAEKQTVMLRQFQLPLPTSGRPAFFAVPVDLTEREALGMHSLVNQIYDTLYAERQQRGGIVLPNGAVVAMSTQPKPS